jgi:biopolymer transport protein ExbB
MKKLFALMALAGMLTFGMSTAAFAQDSAATEMAGDTSATEMAEDSTMAEEAAPMAEEPEEDAAETMPTEPVEEEERSFHQVVKQKFIEGDPVFMSFVVISLILGLAIAIERILYLSMSGSNTKKLLEDVESALNSGGVDAAKEVCRNTRGPVASIFYQGLDRYHEGIDMVEKSVISYGGVQVGQMEKGVSWISLFIALAPMLGFFGTVIGMIQAFDAIAAANNISPGIVASGIGVALITTVSGLLVAMVLQVFYNYIIAKIDSLTNDMEDASISLVDLLVKYNQANK